LYQRVHNHWRVFGPGNGSPSATNIVLVLVVSTKAFSFHNRSSSNFAYRLMTIFSRIAPCRRMVSDFQVKSISLSSNCLYTAAAAAAAAAAAIQQCLHVQRRSVVASDDTWRIKVKCAFPGPTATRCCSCFTNSSSAFQWHDTLHKRSCVQQQINQIKFYRKDHRASYIAVITNLVLFCL